MRIEIGVQDLLGLLREVPPLSARVQEPRPQDHHRLARALLQLHLDRAELAPYDLHHAVDLSGRNGPGLRLVPEQVNRVCGELVTGTLVLL